VQQTDLAFPHLLQPLRQQLGAIFDRLDEFGTRTQELECSRAALVEMGEKSPRHGALRWRFCRASRPMKQLRLLAVPLLLALCHPAAAAAIQCGDACQRAMRDGHALEMQGKYQQALDAYRDAEMAEPLASPPISMAADLMLRLSPQIKPEKLKAWRDTVRATAKRAARLAPDDPIAQETLRQLDDDGASPLRQLNARAAALQAEAENHFSERRYQEALPKYEAAMRADPRSSLPWVGAGDCHFMQQDWARAETLFRRATEIEPNNAQAWRFLSDALLGQGKRAAAEAALLSGIAADPA
jgi:tetratricopeptide (TPR) repeat protein